LAALAAGSAAGHGLARRIPVTWARTATTSLAVLGAMATAVKGLAAL
jgi:hypothetical protein